MSKVLWFAVVCLGLTAVGLLAWLRPDKSGDVATWFSGLSTLLAVSVALYLGGRDARIRRRESEDLAGLTAVRISVIAGEMRDKLAKLTATLDFSDPNSPTGWAGLAVRMNEVEEALGLLPLEDLRTLLPLPGGCAHRLVHGVATLEGLVRTVRSLLDSPAWYMATAEFRTGQFTTFSGEFETALRYVSVAVRQLQDEARKRAPLPSDEEYFGPGEP